MVNKDYVISGRYINLPAHNPLSIGYRGLYTVTGS